MRTAIAKNGCEEGESIEGVGQWSDGITWCDDAKRYGVSWCWRKDLARLIYERWHEAQTRPERLDGEC